MIERNTKNIQSVLELRLVMVLNKKSERLLICSEDAAGKYLQGYNEENILCDVTRPLGTFLIHLERDEDHKWRDALGNLMQAWQQRQAWVYKFAGVNPTEEESVHRLEAKAQEILKEKWECADPICKFIAMRIWYLYLEIQFNTKEAAFHYFVRSTQRMISPFIRDHNCPETGVRCLPDNEIFRWPIELNSDNYTMSVHRGQRRNGVEYIVADSSLVPLRLYYIDKLEQWGKNIIQCKCCKEYFIASTLRYQLCSQSCKKEMELRNRKARLANITTKEIDKLCNRENTYWYLRWKKAKGSDDWSEDALERFQSRRFHFQDEKRQKRQQYDMGKITFAELNDWFREQRDVVDEIMRTKMVTQR